MRGVQFRERRDLAHAGAEGDDLVGAAIDRHRQRLAGRTDVVEQAGRVVGAGGQAGLAPALMTMSSRMSASILRSIAAAGRATSVDVGPVSSPRSPVGGEVGLQAGEDFGVGRRTHRRYS